MELIIDEGNTRAKAAIFINNGIHKVFYADAADEQLMKQIAGFQPTKIAISTVRKIDKDGFALWQNMAPTMVFDHNTPIPVKNLYETPKTLGKDRLAGVIGGRFLIPTGNILIIDAGTCITYDLLDEKDHYLGGSISPGMSMRAKALHQFTGSLPEISNFTTNNLYGRNTHDALVTGIVNGFIHEVNSTIDSFEALYPALNVVLCGGEASYFVNQIKKKIFANQNLVLLGLHKILKFNDA